jgi:hypothetical protein
MVPGGKQGIDDRSDIVDSDVIENIDNACLSIDIHIGCGFGRRAHSGRIVEHGLVEAGFTIGKLVPDITMRATLPKVRRRCPYRGR